MKKSIAFILVLIISFIGIISILLNCFDYTKKSDEKVQIIATLFPQYDFAKQIGGDKVEVKLLLPPGTESHTYEPTPQDMVTISNSDLFIYTGEEMEPWAESLISGIKTDIKVLDLSKTVDLIHIEEFEEIEDDEEEHEHEHEHEHHHEHEHEHEYDPHIWLNPLNAVEMVKSIEEQLIEVDPTNADFYRNNAEKYMSEIQQLDIEFENTIKENNIKKIAFGGAFAYAYFIERYDLDYISAYETCGENAEPSTIKIKNVIDYIKKNNIPVIFYKEYTTGNVARTISEATGAKMVVFNTVHNVSKEEIEAGESYVSIMRKNLEGFKNIN